MSTSDVNTAFSSVAVNRWLGFKLARTESDEVELHLPVRPEFIQEHGVVHGGLLTTLADTAAVYLTQPKLAAGERMTSIELKVNFLDAAWPDRGDLRAVAKVVRAGKRVVVCESQVMQGERALLIGLFTYLRF